MLTLSSKKGARVGVKKPRAAMVIILQRPRGVCSGIFMITAPIKLLIKMSNLTLGKERF